MVAHFNTEANSSDKEVVVVPPPPSMDPRTPKRTHITLPAFVSPNVPPPNPPAPTLQVMVPDDWPELPDNWDPNDDSLDTKIPADKRNFMTGQMCLPMAMRVVQFIKEACTVEYHPGAI